MCSVHTLEAADVAVVGCHKEGRLQRPLVLIICAEDRNGTRETRPERCVRVGWAGGRRTALGSPLVPRRSLKTFGSGCSSMLRRREAPEGTGARVLEAPESLRVVEEGRELAVERANIDDKTRREMREGRESSE